jgi:prepilin-type N-terminal cleavage/methylation domain-containing protein
MNIRFGKGNKAFTLIEVMIVVVIMALLILVAIWAWKTQIDKGYDARRKSDLHKIRTAVEEYEKDHDCYPTRDLLYCDPGTGLNAYLEKIPCDPRTKTDYQYEIPDSVCPDWFRLYTVLDNSADTNLTSGVGQDGAYNYFVSSPNSPRIGVSPSDFFGCRLGVCVPIGWDYQRPGPECDPNFLSSICYSQCSNPQSGMPINECEQW